MFGNLNGMTTILVTGYKDICKAVKEKSEDLYNLEKEFTDKMINEKNQIHKKFKIDL